MIYTKDVTVTKNTDEGTAVRQKIKCSAGILNEFNVVFPPGCAGLVHFTLWQGGHQLIPSTQGMSIRGDDEVVDFREYVVLPNDSNTLEVRAWNTDDTFDHTLHVRLSVLPEDVLAFGTLMSRVPDLVRKILLGRQKKSEKGET